MPDKKQHDLYLQAIYENAKQIIQENRENVNDSDDVYRFSLVSWMKLKEVVESYELFLKHGDS